MDEEETAAAAVVAAATTALLGCHKQIRLEMKIHPDNARTHTQSRGTSHTYHSRNPTNTLKKEESTVAHTSLFYAFGFVVVFVDGVVAVCRFCFTFSILIAWREGQAYTAQFTHTFNAIYKLNTLVCANRMVVVVVVRSFARSSNSWHTGCS